MTRFCFFHCSLLSITMVEVRAILVLFLSLLCVSNGFHLTALPCNVSTIRSCPASLYFVSEKSDNIDEIAVLFGVDSDMLSRTVDGFLIRVNCSCRVNSDEFSAHTNYVVQRGDTWELISSKFQSLVVENPEEQLIASRTVTLDVLCGCLERVEVLTYRIVAGDTLFIICSRFGATVEQTEKLNKIGSPGLLHTGDILFIPATGFGNLILPNEKENKSKFQILIKVGIIVVAVAVILILISVLFWVYCYRKRHQESEVSTKGIKCFCCCFCCFSFLTDAGDDEPGSHLGVIAGFDSDKSTIFRYDEILEATANFSESRKLGQGSYGSVYFGRLRESDVAVKRMKNTKSKEFLAELNMLCSVQHANLIELIGYAAGGQFLCLVYEFAQNGALSDHLHTLATKGQTPLSWTMRVQIALDAAKGLEYIHEQTKPYYVHRDVKTSNILLDSYFRAKIADFGLVKLLEHPPEVGIATSKIVGTFGYLAPEYVRDGCVTSKGDVYSFGVVLMELITGQPALSRSSSTKNTQSSEHRSLVDFMMAAIGDNHDQTAQLARCIDPNLTQYHNDSLVQMALLSKACVEEDRNRRPDMRKVVVQLSHIFSCSLAWELEVRSGH